MRYFKNFLLNQKGLILNKTQELKEYGLNLVDCVTDDAEIASRDLTMNVSLHLHEKDRTVLYQIEKALGKIEDGTYGQCETCEEIIDLKRLKAHPFTTLCIDCKIEQEGPRHFLN
jgi:DnaK suppressor protein